MNLGDPFDIAPCRSWGDPFASLKDCSFCAKAKADFWDGTYMGKPICWDCLVLRHKEEASLFGW